MRAMVVDDEPERVELLEIRKILEECHISLDSDYEFLGVIGADGFCRRVRALARPPDLVVIDYSLGWEDSQGERWDGDKVARFLRQYWQDDVPFYIIFVSQVLRTMSTPYEQLITLLRVPYTGFIEFSLGWKSDFEAHVRCAFDLVRAEKARAIDALDFEQISAFFGPKIQGKAPSLLQAGEIALKVSDSTASVLLLGESGTGKELIANAIHNRSPRRHKPLLTLNSAGLQESLLESELFGHKRGAFTGAIGEKIGLVEKADGGTLFLDEIADMTSQVQAKLLRFLQSGEFYRLGDPTIRKVDVRIIAATNKPLKELIAAGSFREDLYYRLNVVSVDLPPLRDRSEDIRDLAEHFLNIFATKYGARAQAFSPGALRMLRNHSWPGNVRELEHAVQRAVIMCGGNVIEEAHLLFLSSVTKSTSPSDDLLGKPWDEADRMFKRKYFERLVKECTGNVAEVARRSGMSREHVHRILTELDIHPRPKSSSTSDKRS